jgi:hypothetical protein
LEEARQDLSNFIKRNVKKAVGFNGGGANQHKYEYAHKYKYNYNY